MVPIRFGTEGWRAIIAEDFTVENVRRVAQGAAEWMKKEGKSSIAIGYDTRFGGQYFAQSAAETLCSRGIKAIVSKSFVSTPMLCLGIVAHEIDLGLMITASHNSYMHNGCKIKSNIGGPLAQNHIEEIESLIPEKAPTAHKSYDYYLKEKRIEVLDLEEEYYQKIISSFDLKSIRASQLLPIYDAMFGAGQNIFIKIIPEALRLHCRYNPSFGNIEPEPLSNNLIVLGQMTASTPYTCCGIATDGDADRIGLYDERGFYVDAHKTLLLLIYYLCKFKGKKGKILITSAVSEKVEKLAAHFSLEVIRTKVGFKHFTRHMNVEDFLVAGEESGGFAIQGHIPDRDGIWSAFTLIECIAVTRKYLSELLNDIYMIVGTFEYQRLDLEIGQNDSNKVLEHFKNTTLKMIGGRKIQKIDNLDGHKFYFDEDEWVMVRASGNESKLRIYAQSKLRSDLEQILEDTKELVLNLCN